MVRATYLDWGQGVVTLLLVLLGVLGITAGGGASDRAARMSLLLLPSLLGNTRVILCSHASTA